MEWLLGDNDRFLQMLARGDSIQNRALECTSAQICRSQQREVVSLSTRAARFRKWYGNNEYVVNWENDGHEIKERAFNLPTDWIPALVKIALDQDKFFFPESITWSDVDIGALSAIRHQVRGYHAFDATVVSASVTSRVRCNPHRYWQPEFHRSSVFLELLIQPW